MECVGVTQPQHAIVIGGSIAGMCAARVLCDVFERVPVIDRDTYPEDAQHRKGVPQSRHPHALLNGGRQQLETLFPGFVEEMLDGGALWTVKTAVSRIPSPPTRSCNS